MDSNNRRVKKDAFDLIIYLTIALFLQNQKRKNSMNYNYELQKPKLFTDEGQRKFLKVRDNAQRLLNQSGCFTMDKVVACELGNTFEAMACVDRLVELGEIVEVPRNPMMPLQHRLFCEVKLFN